MPTVETIEPDETLRELGFSEVSFPPIKLYRSNNPRDSRFDLSARNRLIPGATWSCFYGTPYFDARRAIFESLHFPYRLPNNLPGPWRSVNGVLLWPTPNLSARVDPNHPEIVYMLDSIDPDRCVTILAFHADALHILVRDQI